MKKILIALMALLAVSAYAATGGGTVTVAASIPTHGKPTVGLAGGGAGNFANGNHYVKCAYVTSTGTTIPGTASDAVNVVDKTSDGKISVTIVASARSEVTGVNIYITKSGGSTYYFHSLRANTNGAVSINIPTDEATDLTEVAPTTDTASAAADTTITSTAGKKFRSVWIRNLDSTNKVYVTMDGTAPVTSATVGSWSIPASTVWGPLDLPRPADGVNSTTIRMRFDTTGGVVSYWFREDN